MLMMGGGLFGASIIIREKTRHLGMAVRAVAPTDWVIKNHLRVLESY